MASAFALAIFSGKIVLLCEWKMTAVIFHSPFHKSGRAGELYLPIERLTVSLRTVRWGGTLLPAGQ